MKSAATLLSLSAFSGVSQMNSAGRDVKAAKLAQWANEADFAPLLRQSLASTSNAAVSCNPVTNQAIVDGTSFDCKDIDFLSYVSLDDMQINIRTNAGSDIWGWEDGNGREVALMCVNNGLWFVDVTSPEDPQVIGSLPSEGEASSSWCDVKVYKDTAYVVKDGASTDNGIQVFDLTRLNGLAGVNPGLTAGYEVFDPDFVYTGHGDSHNILIDNDSGFLYSVGANNGRFGGTGCSGGLHMVDLADPLRPEFAGCADGDGYTHDAQCVVYDGPQRRYRGREICFAFNEDTLSIWDVTNKASPVIISRTGYENHAYCHQGWLNADMTFLFLDDELDESRSRTDKKTKTFVVNVSNLRNPTFETVIVHEKDSIDHNLYFWGAVHEKNWGGGNNGLHDPILKGYAYLSNYASGIRVVEFQESTGFQPRLAGYFDVSPEYDEASFFGAWSNYMFSSGTMIVSSIERGLFVLKPKMAFETVSSTVMETRSASNVVVADSDVTTVIEDDSTWPYVITPLLVLMLPVVYLVAVKRTKAKMMEELPVKVNEGKAVAHFELE